jgi:hypothetical protein
LAKAYACSNFTTKQITNLKSLKSRAFFQVSFFSSPAYTAGSKPKAAAAPKKTVRKVAAAAGGAKKKSRSRAKGNFFFCFFFYTAKKKKKKMSGLTRSSVRDVCAGEKTYTDVVYEAIVMKGKPIKGASLVAISSTRSPSEKKKKNQKKKKKKKKTSNEKSNHQQSTPHPTSQLI